MMRLSNIGHPRFDWVQVEVTTYCNASCIYCPRTVYGRQWQNRHLSLDLFRKAEPAFRKARLVHLQGWGEPFLNPHFFDMVAMVKAAGCQVGTTTNATLLDRKTTARLVEAGLDVVAFSLAGTSLENDGIRKGTHLGQVLEAIRRLKEEKTIRNAERPLIHVAYMLFRSGLDNLRQLPSLVKGSGVSDVVITTLDFAPSENLLDEVVHPETEGEHEEIRSALELLVEEGDSHGLRIHYHLPHPGRRREVCTENVGRALCISADGAVTPCVFTNLQIADASHFLGNEKRPYQRMTFGNLLEAPLVETWKSRTYKAFRRSFKRGPLSDCCQGCPKLC